MIIKDEYGNIETFHCLIEEETIKEYTPIVLKLLHNEPIIHFCVICEKLKLPSWVVNNIMEQKESSYNI